jgi:hypothetical protein
MVSSRRRLRNPRMLQHAPEIYACKIAYLDGDQAPRCVKSSGKAERNCCRQALKQNDRDQGQKRSYRKNRPCNRSGYKMKCDRGYQAVASSGVAARLRENGYR